MRFGRPQLMPQKRLLALGAIFLLAASASAAELAAGPAPVSCDDQLKGIDKKFENVLKKDPQVECQANAKAVVDQNFAVGVPTSDKTLCSDDDTSVCRGTYSRLKKAVQNYKAAFKEGCEKSLAVGQSCTKPSAATDQKDYYLCMAQASRDAAAAEAAAVKAMKSAITEASRYDKLTSAAAAKYRQDQKTIAAAQGSGGVADPDLQMAAQAVRNGSLVLDQSFTDDVRADNGGQSTLQLYQASSGKLAGEQDSAGQLAKEFLKTGQAEQKNRQAAADAMLNAALVNEQRAVAMPTAGTTNASSDKRGGSTITSRDGGGSGSSSSRSSDSSNGSLLSNATSLMGLATAGMGLTAALSKMNNSSAPTLGTGGFGESGTSPTPGSGAGSSAPRGPSVSRLVSGSAAGGTASLIPSPGQSAHSPDTSRGTLGQNADFGRLSESRLPRTGDLGSAGDSRGAGGGASSDSSSGAGENPDLIKDGRSLASASASKESCSVNATNDCTAMNDLKTPQFNAGGSLGVPKIGAADPALATKGALDNIFGPLPNPDALLPKPVDAKGNALLDAAFAPLDDAAGGPAEAPVMAAAEEGPASARSLFARVHLVHQNALKRGVVSLYHKQL